MEREWTVGELAAEVSVSVRTLHHYDEIGLLTPTRRSPAGHRRYTDSDVVRLAQVVALRSIGLSLDDIGRCLDRGEELPTTILRQLRDLDARLAQMTDLRDRLATVAGHIESDHDIDHEQLIHLIGETKMSSTEFYSDDDREYLALQPDQWVIGQVAVA